MQKHNICDLVKTGLPSFALLALTFVSSPMFINPARAQQPIAEQETQAIGIDAYIYFYSLVTMDITRQQISNIEPGKGFGGPMNSSVNIPEYPPQTLKRWFAQTSIRSILLDGLT